MNDLDAHLPGIAAGDADAFARWVAGGEDRLRASLHTFAATVDTEAVVQETLLRIWQVAPRVQVDGRGDSLMRFAIRVARNLAIDTARREGRLAPTEAETLSRMVDAEAPTPSPPDPLLRRLIADCREKLPRRPGQALDARLGARGGQADFDLARQLGMQLNTFLKNVGRARALLAKCLERGGARLPGGAR